MISKKLSSGSSIRHRFTYTLVPVVTAVLLIFSLAIIFYNIKTIEDDLEKRLEDASKLAELILPSALWQFNYAYVNDFIESIFLDEDLVFAKVLVEGAVVKEKHRPGFIQKDFIWFEKSPGFIVKEIDIIHEGRTVGKIQLAMTLQRIKEIIIINSVFSIILLAAIAAVIFFTVFLITRRYIFRPLQKLEDAAILISQGDLDADIDTSGTDEIGHLATTFDQMIKNVKSITASRDELDHEVKERKLAEERVKASLQEKEVLLREIHHRVKNNMQVITSLLRLQCNTIKEQQYVDMFKESQERIKAMALIHERLYQSKDMAKIDFNEYIESLMNGLFRSHGIDADTIATELNVENVSLGLDHAIPCGLIINELLSNSLKYAFPEGRKGEISITLRSNVTGEIELRVSDDGIGIPEDLDLKNTRDSLGLELVTILAEDQLAGKIYLDRIGGTTFRILFKGLT